MSGQATRQERELEELRRQGLAMPARDESGQLINPHIPSYLSKTPWYYGTDGKPTLKHQRQEFHTQDKGVITSGIDAQRNIVQIQETSRNAQQRFRKGACNNCGAMGHKTAECLEKPRAKSAKAANVTFASKDESVKQVAMGFEKKRDRYTHFHAEDWVEMNKRKEEEDKKALEMLRQKEAEERAAMDASHANDAKESDMDTDEEYEMLKKQQSCPTNTMTKISNAPLTGDKITLTLEDRIKLNPALAKHVKDLIILNKQDGSINTGEGLDGSIRLIHDTAKYLHNIDNDDVYYDPKTHSMRENPFAADDPRAALYAGDNAIRNSGIDFMRELELFAHQFHQSTGKELNAMANPTMVRQLKEQYEELKIQTQLDEKKLLLQLYDDASLRSEIDQAESKLKFSTTSNPLSLITANNKRQKVTNVLSEYEDDGTGALNEYDDADEINTTGGVADDNALVILEGLAPTPIRAPPTSNLKVFVSTDALPSTNITLSKKSTLYQEDVLEGNHNKIWGSFYDIPSKKWGYGCCHSLVRHSYCIPIDSKNTGVKRKEPPPSD